LAAQWLGFLQDDLWLELAQRANAQAQKLADGLKALPSVTIEQDVDINEVFVAMDEKLAAHLRAAGGEFYDWVYPGDLWQGRLRRLVTSYATSDKEIEDFIAVARRF
jgi:threonine aldolase